MLEVARGDYDLARPFTAAVAHQGKDPKQHGPQQEEVHQGFAQEFHERLSSLTAGWACTRSARYRRAR